MLVSIQNMPISHQHMTAHAGNPELDAPLLQEAPHLPAEDRYHNLCAVAHTLLPSMPSELHENDVSLPCLICPDPPSFQQQQHLLDRTFQILQQAASGAMTQQHPVPDFQRGVET